MTKVVLAVVAAAVVVIGGCAGQSGPGGSGSQPGNPQPGTNAPGPAKPTERTAENKQADNGVADVSINGSDRIACDSVNAEVKVIAKDGKARWQASAKRSPNFADRLSAQGVEVSPTSGVLEEGRSATIRVRGEFDKTNKYFYVVVVSRDGSTSHGVEFKCR